MEVKDATDSTNFTDENFAESMASFFDDHFTGSPSFVAFPRNPFD
jgi:hypothetical protein